MNQQRILEHQFTEFIPDHIEEGTIYVSIAYATAVHKCCCGCGSQVVTPLSPTDWTLIYDGDSISLDPSIGNWSFDCKSHYWIRHNRVKWAPQWSQAQIESGRARDLTAKQRYFKAAGTASDRETEEQLEKSEGGSVKQGFWQKVWKWRL